jgi:hypothetical protein
VLKLRRGVVHVFEPLAKRKLLIYQRQRKIRLQMQATFLKTIGMVIDGVESPGITVLATGGIRNISFVE